MYIFTYHTTTAIVVCYCVLCPYTSQCTQCLAGLFMPPPTMSIEKLAWTLYSKLDTKNRAGERAKHSGLLPRPPAPRTTQCYFLRPPVVHDKSGCHRCRIARSEYRLRPLSSPLFLGSRGRAGACLCVFMRSYVGPSNIIAINRSDNTCN